MTQISTIYGTYSAESKQRLDYAFFYEDTQIRALKRLAELIGATRFLDIGANIGLYAVHLGSLDILETIDAFEPSAETFRVLNQNRSLQDHGKITAHDIALSDRRDSVEFAVYGDLAGNNALVTTNSSSRTPERIERIECIPLDAIVSDEGRTFVCKIDVEGHELAALRGAETYLSRNRGLLQIETFEKNREETHALMTSYGYDTIFRLQNDFYYTNIETDLRRQIIDLLFDEVANSLDKLKEMKINRRRFTWALRDALNTTDQGRDPVLS